MDAVDSTNSWLLEHGTEAGEVICALHQTAGRGRSGRVWQDRPGDSLMFTVLLPELSPGRLPAAQIVAGYAVVDALLPYADVRMKWPNDAVIQGCKLSGMLIETRFSGNSLAKAVLGIGINICAVPPGMEDAAALSAYCGDLPSHGVLLAELVNSLRIKFDEFSEGLDVAEEWPLYSANYGKIVSFNKFGRKFSAKELGITAEGYIITEGASGTPEINSMGEIGYDFGA